MDNYLEQCFGQDLQMTIPRLSGDKDSLKIALSNIFKNSTQHTFCGEIKIVTFYEEANNELHVAVLDTGTGMTAD